MASGYICLNICFPGLGLRIRQDRKYDRRYGALSIETIRDARGPGAKPGPETVASAQSFGRLSRLFGFYGFGSLWCFSFVTVLSSFFFVG